MTTSKNTKTKPKINKRPDLDKMLVSNNQIADMIGVSRQSIANYKNRYEDFPKPAFVDGNVMVYWREDIEAWNNTKQKNRMAALEYRAKTLEDRAKGMLETAKRMRSN